MTYVPKYLKLVRNRYTSFTQSWASSWASGKSLAGSVFVDIIDESLNPDQGFIDAETAGYLEQRLRLPGGYLIAGDVGMMVDAQTIKAVLEAYCGNSNVGGSWLENSSKVFSTVFQPTYVPKKLIAKVSPNVEDTYGSGTYKARSLLAAVIRSMEFTARAREACVLTCNFLGLKDKQVARESTVSFSTHRPFSFTDGSVTKLGGDSLPVEAVTFRSERIVADDNFVLGSRFLPFVHAAGISATGSLEFGFKDWETFEKFWGVAHATGPQDSPTSYTLELAFEGDLCVSGGTTKQKLRIYCPKVFLDTTNANIDRRERIIQTVNFTALYDQSSGYAVQFLVRNKSKNTFGA